LELDALVASDVVPQFLEGTCVRPGHPGAWDSSSLTHASTGVLFSFVFTGWHSPAPPPPPPGPNNPLPPALRPPPARQVWITTDIHKLLLLAAEPDTQVRTQLWKTTACLDRLLAAAAGYTCTLQDMKGKTATGLVNSRRAIRLCWCLDT
jgi:hypothetical protein